MPDMTVGHMIDDIMKAEIVIHAMQADAFEEDHQAPVDDAGIGEPQYEVGPVLPEDPIPVVPLQKMLRKINPRIPPVIDISSDEDDLEQEPEQRGWVEDIEDFEDDPEEILFDDGDWDVDSDASSVVTIELALMYYGKVVDTSIVVLPIVPPVVPPVPDVQPEVQPEVPQNAEVPIAPAGVQVNLPPVREDLLYERFRRMKPLEFEGPTDPIAADN
ncbi:hypothetical protein TIFTF001_033655 [Ficus carica]|uniref:Uncharacterized protein n=1 Tax=Ficus carica TaxID=3494 RepID=A0AA88DYN6_FICCA|nr:hypothetical protein TIFTF001_033655 [Ficus carica]